MAELGDPIAERFVDWLNRFSGCGFVKRFGKEPSRTRSKQEPRIVCAVLSLPLDRRSAVDLNKFFDACADREAAGVAIFPQVRSESDLADMLAKLDHLPRWRVTSTTDMDRRAVLVTVEWHTASGKWSRTMGFAPLLTMPITRRAPQVAIAMWPGAARSAEQTDVGFIDMPSKLRDHAAVLKKSKKHVKALLDEDPAHAPWRSVAFALAPQFKASLP